MKRKYAKYDDSELLPLLMKRKSIAEAAFAEFYNRYSGKVHAYCVSMITDPEAAEDIFQETFVRFYNTISPDREHTNISSFLMTIARNLCLNYIKKNKYTKPIGEMDFMGENGINYENKELYEIVLGLIELLDDKYKEPLILREIEGMSFKEISEMCGLTLSAAKTRVSRAREKLISMMKPYTDEIKEKSKIR